MDETILDKVEEKNQCTLLHMIAESCDRDFTFAVAPYLTDERVKRQNAKGNTVLHNHIKRIGEKTV